MNKIGSATNQYGIAVATTGQHVNKMGSAVKDAQQKTEGLANKMDRVGKTLKNVGQQALNVGEALSKLTGGINFTDALKEFAEAERGERLLRSAIEANGRSVDDVTERYKVFATQIQNTTTIDDDHVLSLLQQAESLDITGSAAERATKNALGLAESFGLSADASIRATAALEQGSVSPALSRLLPTLRGIKDENEKVVEAQRLLANMFKKVADATDTTSGKMQQMKNLWGEFKETLGSTIAIIVGPVLKGFQYLIDIFKALPKPVTDAIAISLLLVSALGTVAVAVGTASIAFSAMGTTLGVFVTKAAIAKLALIGLKVSLVAGVAYAAHEAISALSGASKAVEELGKATEESKRLNDVWATKFTEGTKSAMKVTEGLTNRMDQRTALAKELENAQKELRGLNSGLSYSSKELDKVNNRWNRLTITSVVDAAKSHQDDWNKKVELGRVRVDELSRALGKIKLPEEDPEILKALEKFDKELETQRKTFGMTSDQVKLYEIGLMGASDAMLNARRQALQLKTVLESIRTAGADVVSRMQAINDAVTDSNLTNRGLSNTIQDYNKLTVRIKELQTEMRNIIPPDIELDIRFNKARMDAITKDLEHVRLFGNQKLNIDVEQATKDLKTFTDEYNKLNKVYQDNKNSIDALRKAEATLDTMPFQLEKLRIQERANKILDDAADITKQYMTPLQQYQEQANQLNILLATGSITQDVYNRALDDANKKMDELEKSAKGAREELQRLQGVDFGSVEAKQRIDDFHEAMREQFKERKRLESLKSNRTVIPPNLSDREKDIEEKAIDKVRQFEIEKRKIDKEKTPFNIPKPINPVGANTNRPDITVVSAAENEIQRNSKESAKRLESIDNTLREINRKPVTSIGIADIQT